MPYEPNPNKKMSKVQKSKIENDDSIKQPQPRVYTQEDVDGILEKREQEKRQRDDGVPNRQSNDDDDSVDIGISPKLVKQLQNTVSVFNALKDFASNPLQKAIESKVGEMAAGVIQNAFSQPSGGGKKDLLDSILNSQLAFGFGQGLGARGPELVEQMGRTFGKEKTDQLADSILGQYRKDSSKGSIPGAPAPGAPAGAGESKQKEKDLLLTLDPNNPEHVTAYAESQGGIRVEVARRMLLIHQDGFIEQMRLQGLDVSGFEQKKQAQQVRESQEQQEMIRLKQEQQEMLEMKKRLDQQLDQQFQQPYRKDVGEPDVGNVGKVVEKVVSYKDKDIQKQEKVKEEIVEKVAEIPDKWDEGNLSEAELESVRRAELARQANMKVVEQQTVIEPVIEPVVGQPVVEIPLVVIEQPVVEPVLQTVPIPLVSEDDTVHGIKEKNITEEKEDIEKKERVARKMLHPEENKDEENAIDHKEMIKNTGLCQKCKKIKVLVETKIGRLCQECRKKYDV